MDSHFGQSPMEIHDLHDVARVKEMEMAHCISYALGHPRGRAHIALYSSSRGRWQGFPKTSLYGDIPMGVLKAVLYA